MTELAPKAPATRAAQDGLIASIAAELLGADDEQLDARLPQTLQRVAEALGADRAFLFQNEEGSDRSHCTHRWCRPGVALGWPSGVVLDLERYPYLRGRFDEEGALCLPALEQLPESAEPERRALEQVGVRSVLVVPVGHAGAADGVTSLHAVRAPRPWTTDEVELLRVVGRLMSAAIARRRATEALRAAETRHRAILESLPDVAVVLSADARVRDLYAPPDLALPVAQDRLLGAELARLLPKSVAGSVLARIRETLASGRARTVQYALPASDRRRYFEVRFARRNAEEVLALVRDVSEQKRAEQRLEEQRRLYEILVQSTQEAIVLSDRDGRILSWNSGAARMFGYHRDEAVGRPLTELLPEHLGPDDEEVTSFVASGKSGMLNRVVERWGRKRDGTHFPVESTISVHTSHGETLLASVIRDITERHDAELAVRESEQRYRQLVQNSADGILLHDEQGRLLDVNDRTVEMLGFSREQLLCMSMPQVERDTQPEVHRQFWRSMRLDQAVTLEGTYQRADGSQFPVETRLAKFGDGPEGPRILVIARDITERKANEAVMLEHREQLRRLASQLTLTEEAQRRELAVQLHDGIGQELAMCRLRIQSYLGAPPGQRSEAHLDHALEFVGQAIAQVHSLTFDLSPPALHELGLPAALRSLGRRIREDHGLAFEYEERGRPVELPKELEVLLFRSVRELAINVVKHASAKTLRVSLRRSRARVELVVADDGVGIDPERMQARTSPGGSGFGLFSVRERLSSVQGELDIRCAEGTIVTIVVPLDEQTPYAYMLGGSA